MRPGNAFTSERNYDEQINPLRMIEWVRFAAKPAANRYPINRVAERNSPGNMERASKFLHNSASRAASKRGEEGRGRVSQLVDAGRASAVGKTSFRSSLVRNRLASDSDASRTLSRAEKFLPPGRGTRCLMNEETCQRKLRLRESRLNRALGCGSVL